MVIWVAWAGTILCPVGEKQGEKEERRYLQLDKLFSAKEETVQEQARLLNRSLKLVYELWAWPLGFYFCFVFSSLHLFLCEVGDFNASQSLDQCFSHISMHPYYLELWGVGRQPYSHNPEILIEVCSNKLLMVQGDTLKTISLTSSYVQLHCLLLPSNAITCTVSVHMEAIHDPRRIIQSNDALQGTVTIRDWLWCKPSCNTADSVGFILRRIADSYWLVCMCQAVCCLYPHYLWDKCRLWASLG